MDTNKIERLVEKNITASGGRRSKDQVYEDLKRRIQFYNFSADEYECAIKHAVKLLKI